jgi:hypothetical protein
MIAATPPRRRSRDEFEGERFMLRLRLPLSAVLLCLSAAPGRAADPAPMPPICVHREVTFPAPCVLPSAEWLRALAEEWGRTPDGAPAGVATVEETTGGALNAIVGPECPQATSWCPEARALIVTYRKPVKLWHVERSAERLKNSAWFGPSDPRPFFDKAETVDLFALPNCCGWAVESDNFGQPDPVPTPPNCAPQRCPGDLYYPPGVVVQWVGAATIPAGTSMLFGFTGPNIWGRGGALQWFVQGYPDLVKQGKIKFSDVAPWPGTR